MKTVNWLLLAAAVFFFACFIGNWSENGNLRSQLVHKEEQLDRKEEQIARMHSEHAMAMNAAAEAIKLRKEIADYERQRMCEAEKALGKNPDYCNGPVPDDVRLLWQEPGRDAASAGSAGAR